LQNFVIHCISLISHRHVGLTCVIDMGLNGILGIKQNCNGSERIIPFLNDDFQLQHGDCQPDANIEKAQKK
jgi:hypothetical protein